MISKDGKIIAIEEGEDEVYRTWYICPVCNGTELNDSHKFCPDCGTKIDGYISRCTEMLHEDKEKDKANSDGFVCKCILGMDHEGKHQGKSIISGRTRTWD